MSAWLVVVTALAVAPSLPAAPVTGQVTYRVGGSIYVDLGTTDGLAPGDTLQVLRGTTGVTVARVVARDVAPQRAACDTLDGGGAIVVGDGVRFTPRPRPLVSPPDSLGAPGAGSPAEPIAGASPVRRAPALRGRVGASAWSVDPGREGAYLQPAADLWLDARGLAGGAVDAVLDVRGRGRAPVSGSRVARESFGTTVYRAAATWHDGRRRHAVTLGRQYAPAFAGVSLFDGLIVRTAGARWGGGALVGAQPEVDGLDPSLDVLQAGAFVEAHSKAGSPTRWNAALGGVTSSQDGEVNRDFLYLGGSWQDRRVTLLLAQELDVARGWRTEVLPGTISWTSTYVSARVEVTPIVQARAGYDGRRSVPLYLDRATPETEFDDALRQGGWIGASVRPRANLRFDADVRRRFGDPSQALTTWSGGGELALTGTRPVRLRARAALADGAEMQTTLWAGGIECNVTHEVSVGGGGGVRTRTDDRFGFTESAPWWNLEADWAIGSGWSAAGSYEQETDDTGGIRLARLGAAYRF